MSFPSPNEPLVKGGAMREFLLWYERTRGPGALSALLVGLKPELARLVDPRLPALGILASTWYPSALTNFMLDRVCEDRGDEGRELAREGNREVVPRMIHGIYRILYEAIASPELYARHVPRMWRRLHSTGDRSFVLRAPGEALSVVENWPGHHPFLCWITIYTMVSLFEAMRFKEVTAEGLTCVGHGAPRCETILRFR